MTRDNNNKLRAVFLAALMFLWLFAGTVAFAGGAAAQSNISLDDVDVNPTTVGQSAQYDVTSTFDDVDDDDEIGAIRVDFDVDDTDAPGNLNDIEAGDISEINVEGNGFTADNVLGPADGFDDSEIVIELQNNIEGDSVSAGDTLSFSVDNVENAGTDTDYTVELGIHQADLTQIDANQLAPAYTLTTATNDIITRNVNGEDRDLFYAGQGIIVTGDELQALDADDDVQLRSVDSFSDDGTSITSSSFEGEFEVTTLGQLENDEEITSVNAFPGSSSTQVVFIDDSGLDANDYFLRGDGITENPDNTWEVAVQRFSAEWEDDSVEADEDEFELELDSQRNTYNVNVSSEDLDYEDLEELFINESPNTNEPRANRPPLVASQVDEYADEDVIVLRGFRDDSLVANVSNADLDPGNYDFELEVTDTGVSDNAELEILEEPDFEVEFDDAQFSQNRGDIARFNLSTDGTNEGDAVDIIIGDRDDSGYQANVTVELDEDDGDISLLMNTFAAGKVDLSDETGTVYFTDPDMDDVGTVISADAITADGDQADDELDTVLEAGIYDLVVQDVDDADDEFDVSTLNLDERSTGDMSIWTSPQGTFSEIGDTDRVFAGVEDGNITQSDTIAIADDRTPRRGDVIVHEVEASGLFGGLAEIQRITAADSDLEALLQSGGISLEFEQTNPQSNRAPLVLDGQGNFDAESALNIVTDDDNNTLYVTADSNQLRFQRDVDSPNQNQQDIAPRVDDEFEVNLTVGPDYLEEFTRDELDSDDSETAADEFEFVDRELDFDTVNDNVTVPPSADAEITGDTTVAPGTEITVRARATGESAFLRTSEVDVTADREFAAGVDLSDVASGTEFTASVRNQAFDNNAETDGIVGELEGPIFTVSDLEPEDAEVEQGTAIDVSATITNDGDENGTQDVALTLDGDELDSQEIELDAGEDTTVEFTDVDTSALDEGTYEHAIETENDSESGTLTITVDEPETDDEPEPDTDDDTPVPDTDDDDEPEPDDQAGFGAVIALVALLGAALLATRRNAQN